MYGHKRYKQVTSRIARRINKNELSYQAGGTQSCRQHGSVKCSEHLLGSSPAMSRCLYLKSDVTRFILVHNVHDFTVC